MEEVKKIFGSSQPKTSTDVSATDERAAQETPKKSRLQNTLKFGLRALDETANIIPIVGHGKGVVHYLQGNKEKGDKAMKLSSRTTGVILGGFLGSLAGGPAGTVVGGALGGQIVDGATTGIESALHEEFKPSGSWVGFSKIAQGNAKLADYAEATLWVTGDAIFGYYLADSYKYILPIAMPITTRYLGPQLKEKGSSLLTRVLKQYNERKLQTFPFNQGPLPRDLSYGIGVCKRLIGGSSLLLNLPIKEDLIHEICTAINIAIKKDYRI